MVLTVNPAVLQPMYAAVLAAATEEPGRSARWSTPRRCASSPPSSSLGLIRSARHGTPVTDGTPVTAASAYRSDGEHQLADVPARLEQPVRLRGL